MKKFLLKIAAIALISASMSSCSKEGAAGPSGPQGPAGTNGVNGNANVKSFQYVVNTTDWTWNSTNFVFYVDIPCAAITDDILNNGMVVGYRKTGTVGSPSWTSMPNVVWPDPSQITSTTYELIYHTLGSFRLRYYWSDYRQTAPTSTQTFKILVVSGTGKMANPGLEWSKYEQVKKGLNLVD